MKTAVEKPLELQLVVKGEIIQSNLDDFKAMVDELLGRLNLDPKTDEEFGQAELDVKGLKLAEKSCLTAKDEALRQMESVNALFVALDETSEGVRDARLKLERQIKAKKAEIRKQIEDAQVERITVAWREDYRKQIQDAMKGKRTLDSLTLAADGVVNEVNMRHAQNIEIINGVKLEHGAGIVPDMRQIIDKSAEDLRALLEQRVELKRVEDERKRLEQKRKEAEAELAEMKRQEAEEQRKNAEKNAEKPDAVLPEPRKIGSIPVGVAPAGVVVSEKENTSAGVSEAEELAEWKREALRCFAGLKEAKERLTHPGNIERVSAFSNAVNLAWKENL